MSQKWSVQSEVLSLQKQLGEPSEQEVVKKP